MKFFSFSWSSTLARWPKLAEKILSCDVIAKDMLIEPETAQDSGAWRGRDKEMSPLSAYLQHCGT